MGYERFDRLKLQLRPLQERVHDMQVDEVAMPQKPAALYTDAGLLAVVSRLRQARAQGRPVIVMTGAHLIKTGMGRYFIELMEEGVVTHVAMNGATAIHDYELARIGATTESVEQYIREGQFGLWTETGAINDAARQAAAEDLGFGEVLGRTIGGPGFPHADVSILAAAYRLGIPATIHVSIGQDIIHEHPNCDGGAVGAASYTDFLIFTRSVQDLEGGVLLNIGTAVMGPEVYLKALSMARNVAHQRGEAIRHFATAVFDIQPVSSRDFSRVPSKSDPEYYHRFYKTILVRTVKDGGESFYIQGEHQQTIPSLWWHVLHGSEEDAR